MSHAPGSVLLEPVLSGTDLLCGYGGTAVVGALSFELRRGEALVLTGADGTGRSTVLRTAAGVHPVVPCASSTLVVGARLHAGRNRGPGSRPGASGRGLVAGCGIGAAAVHRAPGPDPDLTRPPIDSPAGPIPHAQIAAYGRGLGLVLLLTAGLAALVVLPHLWPALLGPLALLTLVAAGVASGADGWV